MNNAQQVIANPSKKSISSNAPGPWRWTSKYETSDGRFTWTLVDSKTGYGIISCDGEGNSPQGINENDIAEAISLLPDFVQLALDIAENIVLADTTLGRQAKDLLEAIGITL
jgi:hypothetical protein